MIMDYNTLAYFLWMENQEPICENCEFADVCGQATAGGTCSEWQIKK